MTSSLSQKSSPLCRIFIFCYVTNQSGTYCKETESFATAILRISSVLKQSGTFPNVHMSTSTASMHIFWVLKQSEIRKNTPELLHITKIIRDIVQCVWFSAHCLNKLNLRLNMVWDLFYPAWNRCIQRHVLFDFRPGWGWNFMDRKNNTMHRSLQSGHLSM